MVYTVKRLKKNRHEIAQKGLFVTGEDLNAYWSMFAMYSLIYPLVWFVSRLDGLLFFSSGYMLIVRARSNKV
jgi:hypothetical protein